MGIISPCNKRCSFLQIGEDEYVCEGCKRTLDQISRWARMNNTERQEIMDKLNVKNIRRD